MFKADSDIFIKYQAFEKLVKAIILLMKRKIEKARHLLEQIKQPSLPSQPQRKGEKQSKDSKSKQVRPEASGTFNEYNDFWFVYYAYRAYASIVQGRYDDGIKDLSTAKLYGKEEELDDGSKFNL